jgi:hypothetical protein
MSLTSEVIATSNIERYLLSVIAKFEDGFFTFTVHDVVIKTKKSMYVGYNVFCPVGNFIYVFHLQGGICICSFDLRTKQINYPKEYSIGLIKHITLSLSLFVSFTIKHQQEYENYLLNDIDSKLCTVLTYGHYGHALIDDIPACFKFIDTFPVKYIYYDKSTHLYFNMSDVFDGNLYNVTSRKIVRHVDPKIHNTAAEKIFLEICNDNLYFFKYIHRNHGSIMSENVIQYLQNVLYKNDAIDSFVLNKKVILLVAKARYKCAVNQVEIFDTIINFYRKQYPNTLFLLQGFTVFYERDHKPTEEDFVLTKSIFDELKLKHDSSYLIDLNGKKIAEYIAYVKHVDFYFSPGGSLQHLAHVFSKRNGLIYSSKAFCDSTKHIFKTGQMSFIHNEHKHIVTVIKPTDEEFKACPRLKGDGGNYNVLFNINEFEKFLEQNNFLEVGH